MHVGPYKLFVGGCDGRRPAGLCDLPGPCGTLPCAREPQQGPGRPVVGRRFRLTVNRRRLRDNRRWPSTDALGPARAGPEEEEEHIRWLKGPRGPSQGSLFGVALPHAALLRGAGVGGGPGGELLAVGGAAPVAERAEAEDAAVRVRRARHVRLAVPPAFQALEPRARPRALERGRRAARAVARGAARPVGPGSARDLQRLPGGVAAAATAAAAAAGAAQRLLPRGGGARGAARRRAAGPGRRCGGLQHLARRLRRGVARAEPRRLRAAVAELRTRRLRGAVAQLRPRGLHGPVRRRGAAAGRLGGGRVARAVPERNGGLPPGELPLLERDLRLALAQGALLGLQHRELVRVLRTRGAPLGRAGRVRVAVHDPEDGQDVAVARRALLGARHHHQLLRRVAAG